MDVCVKFNGEPLNSCQEISLKTTNVNLIGALEERSENRQSQQGSSSEKHEYLHKFSSNLSNSFSVNQLIG